VPEEIQQGSYNNIPNVIEALAATGKVSRLRVADRSGKKLSDISGKHAVTEDGGKSGSTALKQERNRPWTVKEIEAFAKSGKDTEKLLQDRINGSNDRKEKTQLGKELLALQSKNQDVVDDKQDTLTSARPERDAWIRKYAGFKFPKKK
jgi:Mg-chelatase subunit ChlI